MPARRPCHKDLQLAAQVRDELYWALGSIAGDEKLALLEVISVEPWPDASRLLVTLRAPTVQAVENAMLRVQEAAKAIRQEIATAIHRRKVPELVFRVVH